MDKSPFRSTILSRVAIAHAVGLWTTGMWGSIGTTSGFSIFAGALGLFLGGLLSIPWVIALIAIIWFYGSCIERHPLIFAFVGPVVVCATYAVVFGGFLDMVAVSSVASSVCYLALIYWKKWMHRSPAD